MESEAQLVKACQDNGGEVVDNEEKAKFVVIPKSYEEAGKPSDKSNDVLVNMVLEEWFWTCIELGFRVDLCSNPDYTPEFRY